MKSRLPSLPVTAALSLITLCGMVQSGASAADQETVDKSGFTLFNPTPEPLMREFNTDRPDVTESPFTVDAGHYQVELSFLEYTHDRQQEVETDGFSVLPANLKVGLLNNLDLQYIVNPYENILLHGGGFRERQSGFGDTELRAKWNLWGNDGGPQNPTAGGIMPFVRFPTGMDGLSDHHVEGGLIFPLAVQLPAGFDLGTEAEFDFNRNAQNDGYGADLVHTITIGHDIFSEKCNAYIEYVGDASAGIGQKYQAYFDTGVTYLLRKNVQLDAGVNFGLTGGAPEVLIFTGISFRY